MKEGVKEEHLEFLDALRESGGTNMFEAGPYIQRKFYKITEEQAFDILWYWIKTYSKRHPKGGTL